LPFNVTDRIDFTSRLGNQEEGKGAGLNTQDPSRRFKSDEREESKEEGDREAESESHPTG
jgi:hypothetical protein